MWPNACSADGCMHPRSYLLIISEHYHPWDRYKQYTLVIDQFRLLLDYKHSVMPIFDFEFFWSLKKNLENIQNRFEVFRRQYPVVR